MRSDLHIHPLEHKYYFNMLEGFSEVVLDDEDKQWIRAVVDWCRNVRGLDAIALTDHDMIQASLYAVEYVKQAQLPIEIITGAECTVRDPQSEPGDDEVHLLCLGIVKLPKYSSRTPVEKIIRAVHDLGGYVIMSHPINYPESFKRYCHLLDGYEYRNSDKPVFDEGKEHLERHAVSIRAYSNSDFHYDGRFSDVSSRELHSNYYENAVLNG